MSDVKQVKVANWGIYFLQRLKHFFNRTDYCDLTLQFQDNAQLKVHRLVLSACTEYFELLERTCEMYEDCLVMPDDLQADVVVPIVNFMYTGQLDFKMELLERLYQTSQILNLPVLTKLLESHRSEVPKSTPAHSYSAVKKFPKASEPAKIVKPLTPSSSNSSKRSYSTAFENNTMYKKKKVSYTTNKSNRVTNTHSHSALSPVSDTSMTSKKIELIDPRPSRYELPEELDQDNIFDNSFCNISYTSKPLMVHPDTVKRYSPKKNMSFGEGSSTRKFSSGVSTVDIVECKRVGRENNIYDDSLIEQSINDDNEMFSASYINLKDEPLKDSNQLFDQILDQDGPKVTIESKDSKIPSNIDHAKIISEVLKKYPHLVKSNKNIKLKILNTQGSKTKKQQKTSPSVASVHENKLTKAKADMEPDFTYETDVLDSKEAAKLIALGAENIKGPWICLICGTPGKALHFTSYYKFRRHLVDVHNEKPVSNICEYCGLKSLKRNYLLHHLYSHHGVPPPPQYNFPKCNKCNYIALTPGFLVKHKMTHTLRNFRCNVCANLFSSPNQLLTHIQTTGHKYSGDRKTDLQCIYCLKVFLRETNLYAHLKTHHRKEAKSDGIIEDSDDEKMTEDSKQVMKLNNEKFHNIKYEPSTSYDVDYEVDVQFQIQQRPDADVQVVSRKQHNVGLSQKQKILNSGFESPKPAPKPKPVRSQPERSDFLEDSTTASPDYEEIVMIDNNEYILRDHQLIPRKEKIVNDEYIISDLMESDNIQNMQPTTSVEFNNQTTNIDETVQQPGMIIKKPTNLGQPIQIVVSNEEEYKALMSSNHPIIFDNSDTSKTLTVLTAPHESTLESTTIDLDKTQSNDMMIIPDYPLNVTETVPTDNPNIVVVYSHPVHDQNKQYQIITTQGIGTQFVQSSTMITHNYETVTTTAPVMSAHVLGTHLEETWQNNVQTIEPQQVQMAPEEELQSIIQSEHLEITPIENQDVSNNGHNENLLTDPLKDVPAQIVQVDETQHQPPIENVGQTVEEIVHTETHTTNTSDVIMLESHDPSQTYESSEPQISSEFQDQSTTIIKMNTLTTSVVEKEMDTVSTETHTESEVVPQVDATSENTDTIQEPVVDNEIIEPLKETPLLQLDMATETAAADSTENITQPIENTSDSIIPENQVETESQTYTEVMAEITPEPNEQTPLSNEAEEKIQHLTSEWSEDEYDSVPEEPAEIVPIQAETPQPKPPSPGAEETIENIQQELDKQMSTSIPETVVKPTIMNNPLEEINTLDDEPEKVVVADPTDTTETQNDPKQKIVSLLNDWEDNDSQEEDTSLNNDSQEENTVNDNEHIAKSAETSPLPEQPATVAEVQDPKNESIKKLVSDWDDEDD